MELLKKAIKKNELHLFLAGLKRYKCQGINDLPDPNDYNQSWNKEILPYLNSVSDNAAIDLFKSALVKLLDWKEDPNLGLYTIMATLNWFYYYSKENKIKHKLDFEELRPLIVEKLRERQFDLKHDKRWAGAEWNSPDGLWTPLVDTAKFIRDHYNGIDLVPE